MDPIESKIVMKCSDCASDDIKTYPDGSGYCKACGKKFAKFDGAIVEKEIVPTEMDEKDKIIANMRSMDSSPRPKRSAQQKSSDWLAKDGWFWMMVLSGLFLIILLTLSLIGLWMPVDQDVDINPIFSFDINLIRICGSINLIMLIMFILSTIMVVKGLRDD